LEKNFFEYIIALKSDNCQQIKCGDLKNIMIFYKDKKFNLARSQRK